MISQKLQKRIGKIIAWFDKYQGHCDRHDMQVLYTRLVGEEMDEYHEAVLAWDKVKVYDAIADVFWVQATYNHLRGNGQKLNRYCKGIDEDLLCDLLDEVIKSNYSKSLSLQEEGDKSGKVIKCDNYITPDIESVLKKRGLL